MARPNTIPIEGRPQVETRMNQPGLEVTASPVSTVGNNVQAQDNALAQFIQNMRGFTGEFDRFAQVQEKQTIEQEKEKALMQTIETEGAKPVLDASQSAWYQKESMVLFGKASAAKAMTDLQEQLNLLKDDPEALRNLDPQAFLNDWAQNNLAGIDDPDVAAEVYPLIQSTIPRTIGDLHSLKRAQLDADLKVQKKQLEDNAYNYAASRLGAQGENFTPQAMWTTHEDLVRMGLPEKEAAKVLVTMARSAVDSGGLLASSDVLKSKNPRNGWGIEQYLGDDTETRNQVNSLHKFVGETRLRKQKEAEEEAIRLNNEQRADQLRAVNAKIERGELPSPGEFEAITKDMLPGEREELITKIATKQAPLIRKASIVKAMDAAGADRVDGATQAEKQEVWDEKVNAVVGQGVNPHDPASLNTYLSNVKRLLGKHADGNRTMKLTGLFQTLNGVEKLPAPADQNGMLNPSVTLGYETYKMLNGEPSLRPYLDEFTPETREFFKVLERYEGQMGLVGAANQAKVVMAPEAIEARNQFVKNNRDKVAQAALAKLDTEGGWFSAGTSIGPLMKATANAELTGWLAANALSNQDVDQLASQFAEHIQSKFVQVTDTTIDRWTINPRSWGGNDEKRLLLRPSREAVGNLNDVEINEAVLMAEKFMAPEWEAKLGEGTYTLRSMPGNDQFLQVYKNGVPQATGYVSWGQIGKFYTANAAARKGLGKLSEVPPVVSLSRAQLDAHNTVKGLYDADTEAEKAAKNRTYSVETQRVKVDKSNSLPMGNTPWVAPGAKAAKSSTSAKDYFTEGPAVPPTGSRPSTANAKLPPLIPPELAAGLPKGAEVSTNAVGMPEIKLPPTKK